MALGHLTLDIGPPEKGPNTRRRQSPRPWEFAAPGRAHTWLFPPPCPGAGALFFPEHVRSPAPSRPRKSPRPRAPSTTSSREPLGLRLLALCPLPQPVFPPKGSLRTRAETCCHSGVTQAPGGTREGRSPAKGPQTEVTALKTEGGKCHQDTEEAHGAPGQQREVPTGKSSAVRTAPSRRRWALFLRWE